MNPGSKIQESKLVLFPVSTYQATFFFFPFQIAHIITYREFELALSPLPFSLMYIGVEDVEAFPPVLGHLGCDFRVVVGDVLMHEGLHLLYQKQYVINHHCKISKFLMKIIYNTVLYDR